MGKVQTVVMPDHLLFQRVLYFSIIQKKRNCWDPQTLSRWSSPINTVFFFKDKWFRIYFKNGGIVEANVKGIHISEAQQLLSFIEEYPEMVAYGDWKHK